jgi:hypothetical protein
MSGNNTLSERLHLVGALSPTILDGELQECLTSFALFTKEKISASPWKMLEEDAWTERLL